MYGAPAAAWKPHTRCGPLDTAARPSPRCLLFTLFMRNPSVNLVCFERGIHSASTPLAWVGCSLRHSASRGADKVRARVACGVAAPSDLAQEPRSANPRPYGCQRDAELRAASLRQPDKNRASPFPPACPRLPSDPALHPAPATRRPAWATLTPPVQVHALQIAAALQRQLLAGAIHQNTPHAPPPRRRNARDFPRSVADLRPNEPGLQKSAWLSV